MLVAGWRRQCQPNRRRKSSPKLQAAAERPTKSKGRWLGDQIAIRASSKFTSRRRVQFPPERQICRGSRHVDNIVTGQPAIDPLTAKAASPA
jgi:hypothetical protein